MNCARCNAPVPPGARFCRNCGFSITAGVAEPAVVDPSLAKQDVMGDAPTVPTPPWQVQQPAQPASFQQQYPSSEQMPQTQAMPPQAYQPTVAVSPGTLHSSGTQFSSPPAAGRRRKNRLGRVLLILGVVLLLLVAAWFIVLRPYLHGIAQSQVDGVLTNAVNQIDPTQLSVIPRGRTSVPITETTVNNLIVLNSSPSDPVQQMHMTITPGGLRLDFQAYGFSCDVTGVPQASNGQLVMTNVKVEGIAALIMSPDEMTSILNAHLHDATARLHRDVTGVVLKEQEIDIQLG